VQEPCRRKAEFTVASTLDIHFPMVTRADVRRIALSFPETEEAPDRFAFSVRVKDKPKGFAWVWMERVTPKKPRVANPSVLAVRVANLGERDALLSAEPAKFFTEPHYAGFPAVLVRLAEVSVADMRELLRGAWRTQAPPALGDHLTRARVPRAARTPRRSKPARRRDRPEGR
jgi:hypothetical protein